MVCLVISSTKKMRWPSLLTGSKLPVPRRERSGQDIRYILVNDSSTLVWLANLSNLEIHPFLRRAPNIDQPTSMVFDCDLGVGANLLSCARVAFVLRPKLRSLAAKIVTAS